MCVEDRRKCRACVRVQTHDLLWGAVLKNSSRTTKSLAGDYCEEMMVCFMDSVVCINITSLNLLSILETYVGEMVWGDLRSSYIWKMFELGAACICVQGSCDFGDISIRGITVHFTALYFKYFR